MIESNTNIRLLQEARETVWLGAFGLEVGLLVGVLGGAGTKGLAGKLVGVRTALIE